ncbi:MAG: hypothetical protein Q9170_005899 [Blastenia crenularia]
MLVNKHYRLPEVSVVRLAVGPDKSISIKEFLRHIQRDPNILSSNRRAQKQQQLDSTNELQIQPREPNVESPLPAIDDESVPKFIVQQADAEPLRELLNPSQARNIQSSLQGWSSRPADKRTQGRKLYKTRYKNVTSALFASNLSPPPTLQSFTVGKPSKDDETGDQVSSHSPILPEGIEHESRSNIKIKRTPSATTAAEVRSKRQRRHAPVNELQLIESVDNTRSFEDQDVSEPVSSLDDPIETCIETGVFPRRSVNQHANCKRPTAQLPLSNIRKSLRVAKDDSINPSQFAIPPQTPRTTRSSSWKPGSGFKKRDKPHIAKKKKGLAAIGATQKEVKPAKPPPHAVEEQSPAIHRTTINGAIDVEGPETHTSIQCPRKLDPRISTLNKIQTDKASATFKGSDDFHPLEDGAVGVSEGVTLSITHPSSSSSRQANPATLQDETEFPSTFPSKKPRTIRQLQGRRRVNGIVAANPAEVAGSQILLSTVAATEIFSRQPESQLEGHSIGTSMLNPASYFSNAARTLNATPMGKDAQQQRTNSISPLKSKRGMSFVLTPRAEIKGSLVLEMSSGLRRMTSLPFVPPFEKVGGG